MKFKTYFLILLCFQLASSEIKEYEARYSYESDEISINGIRKFEKVDDNFVLNEFTNTIVYKKENDEKYFYELIKKIDPRAKKKKKLKKIKKKLLK